MRGLLIACALVWAGPGWAQQPPNCAVGGFVVSPDSTIWVCTGLGTAPTQVSTGGVAPTWGDITGTLAAQTDLQTELNSKGTSNFSGAYADLTGKPTLGSAAATASSDYATAAQGTTANSALQPSGNGGSLTGLTKAQVGLANVDNTADASKSVSSAATLTTPRTINGVSFNGSGNITVTAAGSTLSDNVPTSKLNSGTGATSATYWRGDGTWQTPAGGSGPSYVVTTQDTTNATTSYANITGLVFNVAAATRYRISCVLPYDANATTTGIGIGWVGPASPTLTRGLMTSGLTTATVGATTINGNDTGAATTASVATTNNIAHLEGIWSNGANAGTIQLRVKSEVAVANAIIVRTGAMCGYAVY